MNDGAAAFTAFAAVALGLALYLWRLGRLAGALEDRVAAIEQSQGPQPPGAA